MNEGITRVLFTAEAIEAKVYALGKQISADYNGRFPLLVGVLNGVVPFMADLLRAITIPVEVDYLAVASYSAETRARGLVRLEKDLDETIKDRHILFVEDMVDTGLTLNYLLQNLRAREPASIEVCTLFNKPRRRLINLPLKYIGFDLPDRFVVGYGLDYRGKYRNLPFLGLLKPEIFNP
ncbi:MAG: hypoxanthine phosphoribosyltransferase [Ardenticatenaceae bacterium]|nr:hypoxanthine phosphoribosyltransferase [Ardenticatenaceae bacterium]MCB8946530.1 hypoxanthine phosphoribosyltransferase [Ardenticatenaceae bacterium]